jgi:hypothetical protein
MLFSPFLIFRPFPPAIERPCDRGRKELPIPASSAIRFDIGSRFWRIANEFLVLD